jgi:ABC-2 type transport system permease protein
MREMAALVRAQWLMAVSYRTRFVFSLLSVLVAVVPVYFVSQALQPLLGNTLATQGGQLFSFIVVGTIALLFITTSLGTLAGIIGGGISTGIWEALLATPARLPALLGGLAAYELLWTLARATVLLLAAWGLGARIAWDGALLALGILTLVVLAYLPIGLVTAALVLAFRSATPLPRIVLLASALLGGAYYPTTAIPGWIQAVSAWIPLTYGLRAMRRALLEGWTLPQVLPDLEMLLLFDAVLLVVGVAAFAAALRHARRSGTLAQY